MRADTLIGENVYNPEGVELGDIKDITLGVNAGSIAYGCYPVMDSPESLKSFLRCHGKL